MMRPDDWRHPCSCSHTLREHLSWPSPFPSLRRPESGPCRRTCACQAFTPPYSGGSEAQP